MEYTVTKFFHILFAIIAVGYNASYGIWLARAARQPAATQLFTLRTGLHGRVSADHVLDRCRARPLRDRPGHRHHAHHAKFPAFAS